MNIHIMLYGWLWVCDSHIRGHTIYTPTYMNGLWTVPLKIPSWDWQRNRCITWNKNITQLIFATISSEPKLALNKLHFTIRLPDTSISFYPSDWIHGWLIALWCVSSFDLMLSMLAICYKTSRCLVNWKYHMLSQEPLDQT